MEHRFLNVKSIIFSTFGGRDIGVHMCECISLEWITELS